MTLGRLAAELQHHLAPDDPLRAYADLLATPGLGGSFRGYLTGTIDLVCRWRAEDGRWRFALADYKTNRLPDYGQAAMLAEMQDKHYLLQALIYLVALHRHLRARLPGYDADRDLAGAAYLFVRGMTPDADRGRRRDGVATVQRAARRDERSVRRMSALPPADPFAARRPRRAPAALEPFAQAGIVASADAHVAAMLARLAGGVDEATLLAAALAVRAPRTGHTCVDLATIASRATGDEEVPADPATLPWPDPATWVTAVGAGPLATGEGPLVLEGSLLYLDRYWRDEGQIAADLRALLAAAPPAVDEAVLAAGLERLFRDGAPARRRGSGGAPPSRHPRRRSRDRQDDHRRALRGAARRAGARRRAGRCRTSASPRRQARPRPV